MNYVVIDIHKRFIYPQGYQFLYAYTQRNQLDNIKLDPAIFGGYYDTPLVQYVYDASGNRTTRTLISGAHAEYDNDELNRVRGQSDYFANGQMGRFDYGFDALTDFMFKERTGNKRRMRAAFAFRGFPVHC